jgi:4-diphosphocytidyl-2-C-methyl-D-erythritol kinase
MFDTLYLSSSEDGKIRLTCQWALGVAAQTAALGLDVASPWDRLPAPEENLVVKALERLRLRAGVQAGARVRLVKRIPAAAGLGGASSDAAAALVGGNRLWGLGWSGSRLAEVAAEVGSDVPFFLRAEGAVCRGRGEQLERIGRWEPLHVGVVRPPVGLSTADVYRRCRASEVPRPVADLIAAAGRGRTTLVGRCLFNRLQPAAEQLSPWIAKLRTAFGHLDCCGHQMTGSGSSYFGVCRHARHARRVAGQLRAAGWQAVFQATTLSEPDRPDDGEAFENARPTTVNPSPVLREEHHGDHRSSH